MYFKLEDIIGILVRTPVVIESLLNNVSQDLLHNNEGQSTWSPYDILGHLIHGEQTDWIPRARIILSKAEGLDFEPFDRFAQFDKSVGKKMTSLLLEFKELRSNNIKILQSFEIREDELKLKGLHPEFGEVNLRQLLSTWAVHDLGHISQISRVMSFQYKEEVGPWVNYLGILQ